ncbi:MAG: amino acid adenylation domain-containing protein [Bacteriovoracaceae bacterium]|nr:amino acid adenylation domain-containing protein [Bacteriovoracaceae bacterium]
MKHSSLDSSENFLLHKVFTSVAKKFPHKLAIKHNQTQITYQKLDELSDQMAKNLIQQGVKGNSLVGVCLNRSPEMIASLLGIFKASCAYLPLDPDYPLERLHYMANDSEIKHVIVDKTTDTLFDDKNLSCTALSMDSLLEQNNEFEGSLPEPEENPMAYVIYTSGSTGNPKGVCVRHQSSRLLLKWNITSTRLLECDTTLQYFPLSFDPSFMEIFSTFFTAKTLVLIGTQERKDPAILLKTIIDEKINRLSVPIVVLNTLVDEINASGKMPASLLEVNCAGDTMKINKTLVEFFSQLDNVHLNNQYGPTEGCVIVTNMNMQGDPTLWSELPPIGQPLTGATIHILDESMKPVALGEKGELHISGPCLAVGYWKREKLTAERFVTAPIDGVDTRLYKTGDLASYDSEGNVLFHGRIDQQVKMNGFRIELGEIEATIIKHPNISDAAVKLIEVNGIKLLAAYYIGDTDSKNLREFLKEKLPANILPHRYKKMDTFPLSPNGKVDKRAFPEIEESGTGKKVDPIDQAEEKILNLWEETLKIGGIGTEDNFFEIGGNSLLAIKLIAKINKELSSSISVAEFFQYPNVSKLAKFIGNKIETKRKKAKKKNISQDIAVVGLAARLPGASNVSEFWKMICDKTEGISFFKDDEIDSAVPVEERNDPNYIKARGILENVDQFDGSFFGLSPRVCELMDPQLRIMMETSHQALENAGIAPTKFDGKIGVFAGMSANTYYKNNIANAPQKIKSVGEWTVTTFNEKDYISTQIAHKLNLNGPALSIHTACSTSLVAIASAVRSLQAGDCEAAIAGGVNVEVPSKAGHLFQEGGIRTKDGHCRPFDHKSSGTLFCDGAGVVVLRPLEDAIADGDTIYGVIKGVGVNNDGNDKVSFSAPSVNGQRGAIEMALNEANIDPSTIELMEAHGTATPVGDPIEVEALTQAWNNKEKKTTYCALGSVKSNIGHTVAAAGVAGFIKAVLSLKNEVIPPSANFTKENPAIDFASTPFYVSKDLKKWQSSKHPRRAAVSSFGIGGTNAHVVLEESPVKIESDNKETESTLPLIFPLSAKNSNSLNASLKQLEAFIQDKEDSDLLDISHTLREGRENFDFRTSVVASTKDELLKSLNSSITAALKYNKASRDDVIFAFPGQGAQYLGMGESLYTNYSVFQESVDKCASILNKYLDCDIRDIIFGKVGDDDTRLKNTYYTQPSIFVIEYSLAQLYLSFGIRPSGLIGHSVGEFAAATISGVMKLEDACMLIAKRGTLMRDLPGGSMLSIRAAQADIQKYLTKKVQLAAVNGPKLCVVAGADEHIDEAILKLQADGIACKKLHTSHAFHSSMMEPIVDQYTKIVSTVSFKSPSIPILSTLTSDWISSEMEDPSYWGRHVRETVLFNPAIKKIIDRKKSVLLEIGPRNTLATLTAQEARVSKGSLVSVASMEGNPGAAELQAFILSLGKLWSQGIAFKWSDTHAAAGSRVPIPTYCFQRKSFWISGKNEKVIKKAQIKIKRNKGTDVNQVLNNLTSDLSIILQDASGFSAEELSPDQTFLEMGFDSLLLTQVALELGRKFECKLTFRQLLDEFSTISSLAFFLVNNAPKSIIMTYESNEEVQVDEEELEVNQLQDQDQIMEEQVQVSLPQPSVSSVPLADANGLEAVVAKQLELMEKQLLLLQGRSVATAPTTTVAKKVVKQAAKQVVVKKTPAQEEKIESVKATVDTSKSAFGAQARINTKQVSELEAKQIKSLHNFMDSYIEKTNKSKEFTQKYRKKNADPRVVTGFRPEIKEIVYPLVVNKSKAQHLWDIDGNEYVDITCGFGSNFFGNQNPRITKALHDQVDRGFEIGPQHELVGECAELICEFTKMERAAFCNTGSEAVLGAIRIARTISGRSKVVVFKGSYHGINDEVIVRGLKDGRAMPAAAGITKSSVSDMIVLEYGSDEALEVIEKEAANIAAVIVEPVQSRRTEFRPVEFLKKVRTLTSNQDIAFIFDEVITGFRIAPGGAQEYFGIQADLATYGKIIGGGLSIGVIAGDSKYMDALDGGDWQFGDQSSPTVGVTYFAGTFVRHPLALRAMREALLILKEEGPQLYDRINKRSDEFVQELNLFSSSVGAPIKINHFGSVLKPKFTDSGANNDVFFAYMRHNGVHVWDGFPWFITMAHTEEDLQQVIAMFKKSVAQMQEAGLFPTNYSQTYTDSKDFITPPVIGARLGKDQNGSPAWFIEDKENAGQYLQVEN